ncbi:MAG: HD domain-containing protein, partial [Candidatus Moraniibacteriota bacterium]
MSPEKNITIDDVLRNVKFDLDFKHEALIRSAYEIAEKAHRGQKRKSGIDDYIQHPLHTALNLAKIGLGAKTITAGLLHDVPEDTDTSSKEIEQKFGKEIATLVDGVTKLGKIKLRGTKEELYLENLRKMFLAMASDIRVVLIKLADRLHNMETLQYLPPDKQQRIALETLEVFAPIANRLGIGEMKARLEDLSFQYLDPENYKHTKKLLHDQYGQRKKNIDRIVENLKEELLKEG